MVLALCFASSSYALDKNKLNATEINKKCEDRAGEWVRGDDYCLKIRSVKSKTIGTQPHLVVLLHGDYQPKSGVVYHQRLAEILTRKPGYIVASVWRPGYFDQNQRRSDGAIGTATGDNYNQNNVSAIKAGIFNLKAKYKPTKVTVIGHSGGAAVAALMLSQSSNLIDNAALISCPCFVQDWRAHMYEKTRAPIWLEKIPVNSPHQSVKNIAANVRLISGKKDDITPADYSVRFHQLLKKEGVVTTLNILPNLGHDILLEDQVIQDLLEFIQ